MFDVRILQPVDVGAILNFEKEILEKNGIDPLENEMQRWHASWREESLNHYLPLGWSFGAFSRPQDAAKEELLGYFLAQPILFQMGFTQVLWVERVNAKDEKIFNELIYVSTTLSKEKHFQKVHFNKQDDVRFVGSLAQTYLLNNRIFEMRTAKF